MKKITATLLAGVCMLCLTAACAASTPPGGTVKITMLPKFKGEYYFDACKVGAQEAIDELNRSGKVVEFLYDGPPQDQATNQKQVEILEGWIAQNVDVMIVSSNDPEGISSTLKKAREKGIRVLTFDADALEDDRDLFVNQVTAEGVAAGLVRVTAEKLALKGYGQKNPANIACISSARTDANQQAWLGEIKRLLSTDDYSWMILRNEETDVYYPGPDETITQIQAGALIGRMGPGKDQIQAAIGLSSMATPALGSQYEAASPKPDPSKTVLTGLATPNALKGYIKNDANPMDAGVLWNCMDLGYLAVQCGYRIASGEIGGSSVSVAAGRLGTRDIENNTVVLGPALIFDQSNIDDFNY